MRDISSIFEYWLKNAVEDLRNQAMEIGKLVYQNTGSNDANGSNGSTGGTTTDGAPEGAKEAN